MRTKLYLMRARFQESFILTHLILSMYVLGGAICVLCGARDKAFLLFSQVHRSSRWSFLVELEDIRLGVHILMLRGCYRRTGKISQGGRRKQ